MKEKFYAVYVTPEYEKWEETQTLKAQVQIKGRLSRIRDEGHFGERRDLGHDLWELKWKNGRRVYYAYLQEAKILLLLGGDKNGQDKDIRQARSIYGKHTTVEERLKSQVTKRDWRKRN